MQQHTDSEQFGEEDKKMNHRSLITNDLPSTFTENYGRVSGFPALARGSNANAAIPRVNKAQAATSFQRNDLPFVYKDTYAGFGVGNAANKLQEESKKRKASDNLPSACIENYAKFSLLPAVSGGVNSAGRQQTHKPAIPGGPDIARLQQTQKPQETKQSSDNNEEEFVFPDRYTKNGRKRAVSFPLKLMKILATKDHADIISWAPDGRSFKIIRPKVFKTRILTTFFKEAKYSSFKRKLHRWGFERNKAQEEAEKDDWFGSEIYYHPLFQRDRFDLVDKMSCQDGKHPPVADHLVAKIEETPHFFPQNQPMHLPPTSFLSSPSMQSRPLVPPSLSQAQLSLPPQEVNPSNMSSAALDAAIDAEVARRMRRFSDPNAAIEAEISRRMNQRLEAEALKERIEAESIARRARVRALFLRETQQLQHQQQLQNQQQQHQQQRPQHQNFAALSSNIDNLMNSRRQHLNIDLATLQGLPGGRNAPQLNPASSKDNQKNSSSTRIDRIASLRVPDEGPQQQPPQGDHAKTA